VVALSEREKTNGEQRARTESGEDQLRAEIHWVVVLSEKELTNREWTHCALHCVAVLSAPLTMGAGGGLAERGAVCRGDEP
jgi:hypothetical protein